MPGPATYRNLALRRPAYHSSSRDYNLTAQLVTDGIAASGPPRWLSTSTSQGGPATKPEREFVVDHFSTSRVDLEKPPGYAWRDVQPLPTTGAGDDDLRLWTHFE